MFSRFRLVALACVAAFFLFAEAHATVVTYGFTGTLSNPVNGGTSVSGSFVVDNVAATLTNFSLTTSYGSATPSNYTAQILQFLPAVQPNADFTELAFRPNNVSLSLVDPNIGLLFESSLANFNGGSLFTAAITPVVGESLASVVNCVNCSLPLAGGSLFASGTATATPLPAALPLFATGLGALGLLGWRRKRKSRDK
jgi:hypothetical protein